MKNIDSFARSQYLRVFLWILYPSLFISVAIAYGMQSCVPIFIAVLFSLVAPIPLLFVINQVSGVLGSLYSGRGAGAKLADQLAGELTKGRHLKSEKRFVEALQTANLILEQMPEHAEALLLKAQILSEGFANDAAAKECLRKIMRLELPPESTTRQWAKGMLEEVNLRLQEKKQQESS